MSNKDDFNPFRDNTPSHELIKKRNEEQKERTNKVIQKAKETVDEIKKRHNEKYPDDSAE